MRIFELSDGCPATSQGRCGLFQFDQSKALNSYKGNTVIFLSLDIRSIRRKRRFGFTSFSDSGVHIFSGSLPVGRAPLFLRRFIYFFMFRILFKKATQQFGKPDLIHAHFGRTIGYVAWKANRKYGIDYAITEHDSGLLTNSPSGKEKRILFQIYKNAKFRIAVSSIFCKKLSQEFSLPFSFVPNVIDTSAFFFLNRKGGAHNPFVFVTAGQLIQRKGMDVLINAFALLRQRNPNVALNIIGSGPEEQRLRQLSQNLEVTECIHFLGQLSRSQMARVFSESDAFVLASKGETFGVVFIEAMCCGLPVIGTVCGGPESFITEKVGLLANVNDVDSLSLNMEDIIANYCRFDSSYISAFAHSSFSPERISGMLMEIFSK
jgi:glycosyltransferase involved in cell wall biosynthesis